MIPAQHNLPFQRISGCIYPETQPKEAKEVLREHNKAGVEKIKTNPDALESTDCLLISNETHEALCKEGI